MRPSVDRSLALRNAVCGCDASQAAREPARVHHVSAAAAAAAGGAKPVAEVGGIHWSFATSQIRHIVEGFSNH